MTAGGCRVRRGLLVAMRFGIGICCYRFIGQVRAFSGEYGTLDGSVEERRDGRYGNAVGAHAAGAGGHAVVDDSGPSAATAAFAGRQRRCGTAPLTPNRSGPYSVR